MNIEILKQLRKGWLWVVPAVLLLLALLPVLHSYWYVLLLKCIVTLAAAYIAYILFTEKQKDYLIWGIVFIVIAVLYNPIITVFILKRLWVPLTLVVAMAFIANWYLVFRNQDSII
jgi:hypothetical protein